MSSVSSVAVRVTLSGYCQCCILCCYQGHNSGYCQSCIFCCCQGQTSWLLSMLRPLLCQVCMLCLLPALYFLVTTGVVSLGYQWSCISWLPLELPLLVTIKVTSFLDNLTVLLGVRTVKSPPQSGCGAWRRAEFRLQRKGEARNSSNPSFPQLCLHLPGKDRQLSLQYCPMTNYSKMCQLN